jgi:hypothetical protein
MKHVILCKIWRKAANGKEIVIDNLYLPADWIMTGKMFKRETVSFADEVWRVERKEGNVET